MAETTTVETGDHQPEYPQNLVKKPKRWGLLLILSILVLLVIAAGVLWAVKRPQTVNPQNTAVVTNTTNTNQTVVSVPTANVPTAAKEKSTAGFIIGTKDNSTWTYYTQALDGSKTKLFSFAVKDNFGASEASLSPDGKTLVYTTNDDSLASYNLTSNEERVILNSTPYDPNSKTVAELRSFQNPAFSPDGKHILVRLIGWEVAGSGIVNADGTGYTTIGSNYSSVWSPDSLHIAHYSENNDFGGEPGGLFISTVEQPQNPRQLLPKGDRSVNSHNEYKDVYSANYSPDGTKIAISYRYLSYTSGSDNNDQNRVRNHRAVYAINSDGSNFHQVSSNQSFSDTPFWLSNNKIAYSLSNYYSHKDQGIYTIQDDGTANALLTTYGSDPQINRYEITAISPDRKLLLYRVGVTNTDGTSTEWRKMIVYSLEKNGLLFEASTTATDSFGGWIMQ
jgi:hypothetical protein